MSRLYLLFLLMMLPCVTLLSIMIIPLSRMPDSYSPYDDSYSDTVIKIMGLFAMVFMYAYFISTIEREPKIKRLNR